ncbi:peptide MFS transporter [Riemerella columbipharyngis]|uniref:Proton-dependent oligopeptide transporter, POT family n=1 Tax=Riemerella columbipharyngis TaxID=1071918 RepID=A0A1G7DKE2_9FLAO|nr:peptide MFS transporter [Riemerella columbipharyngis]SDE51998.1 proton-dependent oligopeptide transporter, POT family [Riemerella columbipharyngis]
MDAAMASPKKGHPKGLYLLFFTEMWERFSYYGMRGILVLYLTKKYMEGGLNIDSSTATLIYGWFTGLVYFTPLIGGWLADNFLGQRKAITIGGITMMIGQFVLFSINTHTGMYLGLLLLIIGNGFFKPNISTLVGGLYPENDPRRDSAFSIFYMGINLGALIAPIVVGILTDDLFATQNVDGSIKYGYRWGFLASGIGMLLGQIIYNTSAKKYLGDLGMHPIKKKESLKEEELEVAAIADNPGLAEKGSDLYTAETQVDDQEKKRIERQRVTVIFIFFFFAIFFFAGFEQAGSSLTLYTDQFINRDVTLPFIGNYTIPTPLFQSVNPLFIMILAPLFAIFWQSKIGQKLTTPFKMGLGMVILGLGFAFMLMAVYHGSGDKYSIFISNQEIVAKASVWLVVLTYLLHTIGELCLSPVGLSVVTKLSPPRLASLLMGVWLLASFFANVIGGQLASTIEKLGAGPIFFYVSLFVIFCGLVMLALNKIIVKMMHGVK